MYSTSLHTKRGCPMATHIERYMSKHTGGHGTTAHTAGQGCTPAGRSPLPGRSHSIVCLQPLGGAEQAEQWHREPAVRATHDFTAFDTGMEDCRVASSWFNRSQSCSIFLSCWSMVYQHRRASQLCRPRLQEVPRACDGKDTVMRERALPASNRHPTGMCCCRSVPSPDDNKYHSPLSTCRTRAERGPGARDAER